MPRYLLDTSVYCQPLKPRPLPAVIARWEAAGEAAISVSAIAEAELLYGLTLKKSPRLWDHYEQLLKGRYPLVAVGGAVAACFAELKAFCTESGHPIPDLDLLVAASAKQSSLIVVTTNIRHFRGLPGVAAEDWSQ